jgi:magnesium chelatase subunit I
MNTAEEANKEILEEVEAPVEMDAVEESMPDASTGRPSRLLDILRTASPAHKILKGPEPDLGLAEVEPYPFLAIVGQPEMKLALILNVINPSVGGVLLIGARGTAKTTAVRALPDLLPTSRRSLCPEGCTEKMLDEGGMAAICDDCATRAGYGKPLTVEERVRLVELPLNARLEDVVGKINERIALEQNRVRLEQGILSQADKNILYIDEVNLLEGAVSDAILDAAAQGFFAVRRGLLNLTYRSRFTLIGSMNPEEGFLRPQLMDRFGLRAVVRGAESSADRYRIYENALLYRNNPDGLASSYAEQTLALAQEIEAAIALLPKVTVSKKARDLGLKLTQDLKIASNRAEITLFEATRAHAAADGRDIAGPSDVRAVAVMALRLRQSPKLLEFFQDQAREDARVQEVLARSK